MFSWIGPPFPLLLSHFPGQCTRFRWFLPPSKDSANRKLVQSGDESCQKVTTNWCQKGAKGPKRVGWAEPLWWDRCASASHFLRPGWAAPARCFGLFGISARAVVATTWQEHTIRYLQTTICPKSIRSRACPLITPSSPLSTPISDHFLNPLNYLRDDKVSSFPVFPSRTSSPLCALSGGPI